MALNKYMHPRNIYKKMRPDFKQLAIKYPEFRKHVTQDIAGKVHLDFKKPECLRALTWALLKDNFGIEIDIPLDRLIPTVPQRLNYILWVEDLLGGKEKNVHGIDIGCGALCIYPILGCKKNKWMFTATEVDDVNLQYARKNVMKNGMEDLIDVVEVKENSMLYDNIQARAEQFDFCMCNPPFFADHLEAQAVTTSKSVDRPGPSGVGSVCDTESVAKGGEVKFVKRIIEDSMRLQLKVRIYSSMLGKKASLATLKNELRKNKITNFSSTEFCQGRTMRWAIAWTFDESVVFPKSQFQSHKEKEKPPLVFTIPKSVIGHAGYNFERITCKVKAVLEELKIEYTTVKSDDKEQSFCIKAVENTWSHQRKKRRQIKQEQNKSSGETVESESCTDSKKAEEENFSKSETALHDFADKNVRVDYSFAETQVMPGKRKHDFLNSGIGKEKADISGNKRSKMDNVESRNIEKIESGQTVDIGMMQTSKETESESLKNENSKQSSISNRSSTERVFENHPAPDTVTVSSKYINVINVDSKMSNCNKIVENKEDETEDKSLITSYHVVKNSVQSTPNKDMFLLRSLLTVKMCGSDDNISINLEMKWIEGQNREVMNQVMQYFRNNLSSF